MKSIALIILWYGKFNNYFEVWKKSATYNKTVDFYIFTDNGYTDNENSNIHIVHMPISEVKMRFEKIVNTSVKVFPYKLCDFRPLYGLAFADYVQGYDYWGHCDVDLIFGDIRHFLTDEVLSYDKVLQRGHFSLYKNCDFMNHLFEKTAEKNMAYPYLKALKTNFSCYFDEFLGINIVADMYATVFKDQRIEKVVLDVPAHRLKFYSPVHKKNYYCVWDSGRLYRIFENSESDQQEEFMYVHLQKRPMVNEITDDLDTLNLFYIKPNTLSLDKTYNYTDSEEKEYSVAYQKQDKIKSVKKLLKFGLIDCVAHKYRRRKIDRWLRENKPDF